MSSERRASIGGRPQIARRLDTLVEHNFATKWELHSNGRYWRVWFGHGIESMTPYCTPWYSQAQIGAWIDGAASMGAAV